MTDDLLAACVCSVWRLAAAARQATPAYTESQALAYGVSRLPGCYAAASRVFKELQLRAVGFQPRSMLDFGSGPGTAIWAAQEVREIGARGAGGGEGAGQPSRWDPAGVPGGGGPSGGGGGRALRCSSCLNGAAAAAAAAASSSKCQAGVASGHSAC
jgi:uncharacterized membrane protein YgcG